RLVLLGVRENSRGVPVRVTLAPKADGAVSGAERYRLTVSADGVDIVAGDAAGAFYGLQSLAALIMPGSTRVPLVRIEDGPRYSFRGLHVDVARNFHSKRLLLDLLDQMAAYKLNKLHLHLGDDEGWRLDIPGLPELAQVGGKRCHDLREDTCLLPQL